MGMLHFVISHIHPLPASPDNEKYEGRDFSFFLAQPRSTKQQSIADKPNEIKHMMSKTLPNAFWAVAILLLHHVPWCFVSALMVGTGIVTPDRTLLSWSRQAEIQETSEIDPPVKLIEFSDDAELGQNNCTLDLQSPRKWLEYYEMEDGQEGAYTVMRCDFYPSMNRWSLWGVPFHMERLMNSFRSLAMISSDDRFRREDLSIAINATNHVLKTLLNEAGQCQETSDSPSESAITVMITILWTPTIGRRIKVRGHAFHSGEPPLAIARRYNPVPIVVSIAQRQDDNKLKKHSVLPNRYEDRPNAKVSSWCRRRIPLEDEFKKMGIGEVILTRESGDDVELLEGLTSNLFIVYQDGSLRTASEEFVLGGYARRLVLDHAEKCNIRIQVGPLRLSESAEWKEIFTTSAIKVITPVSKVVLMGQEDDGSRTEDTLWTQHSPKENELWRRLYWNIVENYR